MDDYIDFAPPRREIAFIELNDNVKHDYLHEFCWYALLSFQCYNSTTLVEGANENSPIFRSIPIQPMGVI